MVSILDLNAGFSDSEDDVDYVPFESDKYDDCSKEEKDLSDEHASKKCKPNIIERPIVKKLADDAWVRFLENVSKDSSYGKKMPVEQVANTFFNGTQDSNIVSKSECTSVKSFSTIHDLEIENKKVIDEKIPLIGSEQKVLLRNEIVDSSLKSIDNKRLQSTVNNSPPFPTTQPRSGFSFILGAISNKGKKESILEKSLKDWKYFKEQEGIGKDLEIFNKGRQGFIERQRFLERSDRRSFQNEKNVRLFDKKK